MRTLGKLTLAILFCGLSAGAPARTVVECVDPDGDMSIRDFCPPDYFQKAEKHVRGLLGPRGPSIAAAAAANPIALYTVPDCDACDLARNALQTRNIPYAEIDVQDDSEKQEAMRAKTGNLTVPAILIGERVLSGYSRDAIDGALIEAGYPIENTSVSAASPQPSVPADTDDTDDASEGSSGPDSASADGESESEGEGEIEDAEYPVDQAELDTDADF